MIKRLQGEKQMTLNQQHDEREEIVVEGRVALCRCWQSSRFPYCDGAHRQYNAEHGDRLGPVIVHCAVPPVPDTESPE